MRYMYKIASTPGVFEKCVGVKMIDITMKGIGKGQYKN